MTEALPESLVALAGSRGLELERDHSGSLLLSRHGLGARIEDTALPGSVEGSIEGDPDTRRCTTAILLGVRLGLDKIAYERQQALRFGPSGPRQARPLRPRPAGVVRYHEAPSVYGERLLRLVPSLTRIWAEAVCGQPLWAESWYGPGLETLFILETGRFLHAFGAADKPETEEGRKKAYRDARAALFYDSYKVRPSSIHDAAGGTIHVLETVEGLGASRAIILPEFDYDSARIGAFFAIPSHDQLLIARPRTDRDATLEALKEATLDAYTAARHPLTTAIFAFDADAIHFLDRGHRKASVGDDALSVPEVHRVDLAPSSTRD